MTLTQAWVALFIAGVGAGLLMATLRGIGGR